MSIQNKLSSSPKRRDITYHSRMQKQKNYLIKVDKQFMADLQTQQEIIIDGQRQDQVIINANNNTYRMRGVNISTTMLVINQMGTIFQQSASYLQVQKYQPLFVDIYRQLNDLSCKKPDKENIDSWADIIQHHSFTDYSIKKQFFLNEVNCQKLCKAMNLTKIRALMEQQNQMRYIYVGLDLAVWFMRQIIKLYNKIGKSTFQLISSSQIIEQIPTINYDILQWITKFYQFKIQDNLQNHISLTKKSIAKFVITEMAISKKQYTEYNFNEFLQEMIMIYMPAQAQITPAWMKDKQKQKDREQLFASKLDYFIQLKGDKYIYYDYLLIEPDVNQRLKFLTGFKKRWRASQLKAIFRGFDTVQNGKSISISDLLLKKFRKFGQQYEIKFILPTK